MFKVQSFVESSNLRQCSEREALCTNIFVRESYRVAKGSILYRSVKEPLLIAGKELISECSSGVIKSSVGSVTNTIIGYCGGLVAVRYVYKLSSPGKVKRIARITYNVACVPYKIWKYGIDSVFSSFGLDALENRVFGRTISVTGPAAGIGDFNFTADEAVQLFDKLKE